MCGTTRPPIPNLLAYPAPVYWTDETYTTVSGVFTEGNPAATGNLNSLAGWLLAELHGLALTGAERRHGAQWQLLLHRDQGLSSGGCGCGLDGDW